MKIDAKDVARFFSKTKKLEDVRMFVESSCLEWTAAKCETGYGRFGIGGRVVQSHRFAWELKNGPIPNGMLVCHRCDNPSCVEATHLFIGTNMDNSNDKVLKGRQASGERSGARIHPERLCRGERRRRISLEHAPRGDRNGQAKISAEDVVEVFRFRSSGMLMRDIAVKIGVKTAQISRILSRKRWSHIDVSAVGRNV